MIIGFLILSIVAIIVITIIMLKSKAEWESPDYTWNIKSTCVVLDIIAACICIVMIIPTCCLATGISKEHVIEQQIEMYNEENSKIEKSIDSIVQNYLEHEKDTFSDLKTDKSGMTLITMYPKLKSDMLVKKQLKVYLDNNNKIKELKEEKINIQTQKFILYFG